MPSRRRVTYRPQAPAEEKEDRQVPHASQAPLGSACPLGRRRAGAGSRRGTIGPGGRRCPGAAAARGRRAEPPAPRAAAALRLKAAPAPAPAAARSGGRQLPAPPSPCPSLLSSSSTPRLASLPLLSSAPLRRCLFSSSPSPPLPLPPMRCGSPPPPLRSPPWGCGQRWALAASLQEPEKPPQASF